MGAAVALTVGLALAGRPAWAFAGGAATVTAAIGALRWPPSEASASTVRARLAVNSAMAAVGAAAAFGVLRFVLGPAYPAVRAWAGSPWAALTFTVAFGAVAYLDSRPAD